MARRRAYRRSQQKVEVEILSRSLPEWTPLAAIDTLRLAKSLKPGLKSYGLANLGTEFGLAEQAAERTGRPTPLGALRCHADGPTSHPPAVSVDERAAPKGAYGCRYLRPETGIPFVNSAIKIGITGTHSTGKSSFLEAVRQKLDPDLKVQRIGDFAVKAKELGFPILRGHNYESTLWIISECIRLEAEASLANDVVLVDRPVIDALGYLHGALRLTGRKIGDKRSTELVTIVKAHTPDYDLLVRTS